MRRAPTALLPLVVLAVACGGDEGADGTPATTMVPATTSSTTAAPATTEPATTTVPAEDDAWVEGDVVLRAGDCFVEIEAGEEAKRRPVRCDGPHDGEVVATGAKCPLGIGRDEFAAIVSAYVGIEEEDVGGWLDQNGLAGSSTVWIGEGGKVAATMCYLAADGGGDLDHSYASAGNGDATGIAGTWTGEIGSSTSDFTDSLTLVLEGGCEAGEICGSYETGSGCVGDLRFLREEGAGYVFEEVFRSGEDYCLDGGRETLTLLGGDLLEYSFEYEGAGGPVRSSGELTRG